MLRRNGIAYYQPLIAIPRAWTSGTGKKLLTGEVVLVKAQDTTAMAQYAGKLKDKIVMTWSTAQLKPSFEADANRLQILLSTGWRLRKCNANRWTKSATAKSSTAKSNQSFCYTATHERNDQPGKTSFGTHNESKWK
jgi:hypothetical protein